MERNSKILKSASINLIEIPKNSGMYPRLAQKNCENIIGTVSIPVGIAGPLPIQGRYAKGDFVIPLATTESCLVASTNRGCKIIRENGGVLITGEKIGITRAPVFQLESKQQFNEITRFLKNNFRRLQKECKMISQHLRLIKIIPYQQAKYLFLKFFFDTDEAMGMNMAVFGCEHLLNKIIIPSTNLKLIALSGNLCCDKKPALINKTDGRGFKIQAQIILTTKSITKILKTTPTNIYEVFQAKIIEGSKLAGSLGKNAHHANLVAALFLATGQDPAHVVEGSIGDTKIEIINSKTLKFSIDMPSIVCGTVGGGCHLPKQQEALKLLGLDNQPKTSFKLAEIIAATVLAGEISLLGALANHDLAKSHYIFCRN